MTVPRPHRQFWPRPGNGGVDQCAEINAVEINADQSNIIWRPAGLTFHQSPQPAIMPGAATGVRQLAEPPATTEIVVPRADPEMKVR